MGARAANSHKLEMLDRPINTMFPVAYDRRRISKEKAWKGRREREREGVYVGLKSSEIEGGLKRGARLAGMERGTKIIGQILRKRQRVRTSDA